MYKKRLKYVNGANSDMVRRIVKRLKPKTTAWGAGGQVNTNGRKLPRATVLKYLRAIEKRDGVTFPRLRD